MLGSGPAMVAHYLVTVGSELESPCPGLYNIFGGGSGRVRLVGQEGY